MLAMSIVEQARGFNWLTSGGKEVSPRLALSMYEQKMR